MKVVLRCAFVALFPLLASAAGTATVRVTNAGSVPIVVEGRTIRPSATESVSVPAGEAGAIAVSAPDGWGFAAPVDHPSLRNGATYSLRLAPVRGAAAAPVPSTAAAPVPAPAAPVAPPAVRSDLSAPVSVTLLLPGGVPLEMVRLPNGVWAGRYEVTQAQWESVMGPDAKGWVEKRIAEVRNEEHRPRFREFCPIRPDNPVTFVSRDDCQDFLRAINALRLDGSRFLFRLPTEPEWKVAAAAGGNPKGFGLLPDGSEAAFDEVCWHAGNSDELHRVGELKPNAYGLFDMTGNVSEWTSTPCPGRPWWWMCGGDAFNSRPPIDATVSDRGGDRPDARHCWCGFRLFADVVPPVRPRPSLPTPPSPLPTPPSPLPPPPSTLPPPTRPLPPPTRPLPPPARSLPPPARPLPPPTRPLPTTPRPAATTPRPLPATTHPLPTRASAPPPVRVVPQPVKSPSHAEDPLPGVSATILLPGGVPLEMVRLPNGVWAGRYEVTQAQWESVMGPTAKGWVEKRIVEESEKPMDSSRKNLYPGGPEDFRSTSRKRCPSRPDNPVTFVSWDDCQDFLRAINALRLDGARLRFRLPTEPEWKISAAAGGSRDGWGRLPGGGEAEIDDVGWHGGNSGGTIHPVGRKKPNAYGLFDMIGNVREWTDTSINEGLWRWTCGGDVLARADENNVAERCGEWANERGDLLGFRLFANGTAAVPPPPPATTTTTTTTTFPPPPATTRPPQPRPARPGPERPPDGGSYVGGFDLTRVSPDEADLVVFRGRMNATALPANGFATSYSLGKFHLFNRTGFRIVECRVRVEFAAGLGMDLVFKDVPPGDDRPAENDFATVGKAALRSAGEEPFLFPSLVLVEKVANGRVEIVDLYGTVSVGFRFSE